MIKEKKELTREKGFIPIKDLKDRRGIFFQKPLALCPRAAVLISLRRVRLQGERTGAADVSSRIFPCEFTLLYAVVRSC